jgi:hypothetical protein
MPLSRNGPPRKPPDDGGEGAASKPPDDSGGSGVTKVKIELGLVALAALAIVYLLATTSSTTASGGSTPPDPQIEALTRTGISPERANQALAVQGEVARTELIAKVATALGSAFAGVWFEPAVAKFYIGVTSDASRQKAEKVVDKANMTADVVITSVRSTWAELLAAQEKWNKEHAELFGSSQASSGILTPRNAVSVELSTSLSSVERASLEAEAATANVNFVISVAAPSRFGITPTAQKTCVASFVKFVAYCEAAITAGVSLFFGAATEPTCTSGPMLISGQETYMLTAGHCFGASSPTGGTSENKAVKSKFTTGGLREIGNEVVWIKKTDRDMAIVKVKAPSGEFSEALPVPVPAVMAEWGLVNTTTPHAVNGQETVESVASGQSVCREGMTSGESCGVIKALNVRVNQKTEHLVETNACAEGGDSGGPFFFKTGGEVRMIGITIAATQQCSPQITTITLFEPLVGMQGALQQYGILNTFTGKSLLTTLNENRCP